MKKKFKVFDSLADAKKWIATKDFFDNIGSIRNGYMHDYVFYQIEKNLILRVHTYDHCGCGCDTATGGSTQVVGRIRK